MTKILVSRRLCVPQTDFTYTTSANTRQILHTNLTFELQITALTCLWPLALIEKLWMSDSLKHLLLSSYSSTMNAVNYAATIIRCKWKRLKSPGVMETIMQQCVEKNTKKPPQKLAASRLIHVLSFTLWPACVRWLTAVMSALPRWWSWKCRGWSLWLPIGSSTAPWRWKEARSSRQTRQKLPSPRKCVGVRSLSRSRRLKNHRGKNSEGRIITIQ